jgi:hypothetical protein
MAAFNTVTALVRDIRTNTTHSRANDEAHVLARQVLTHSGDIDPAGDGYLTIRRDRRTLRAPHRHQDSIPRRRPDPALRDQRPGLTDQKIRHYVRSPDARRRQQPHEPQHLGG